jgi:hypothetical protein
VKIKELFINRYKIVAVVDNDICLTEKFITHGEESTKAYRIGLAKILDAASKDGLQNIPAAWFHDANKNKKIYEFIKGPLRLFFFKGKDNHIVVCTNGVRKSGKKSNKQLVENAAQWQELYFKAVSNNNLEVISHDNQ